MSSDTAKIINYGRSKSAEKAESWLKEHAKDSDINLTWTSPPAEGGPRRAVVSEDPAQSSALQDMPEYVTSAINSATVSELMEMGITERRAQKAVYVTKNSGAAAAVDLLSNHANDFDIDAVPKQLLSKEEAQAQAAEL